ncbi:MAG: hypothetical protein JXR03_04940 [Cyclobacteriaceae bacterium]
MINKNRKLVALWLLAIHALSSTSFIFIGENGGPNPPEVLGFQQAGASDMVDLFTGDFKYNIPLFELPGPNGGYPFNLSYNAGISMNQEASWAGLGWNIGAGAIHRQMRGFPDEFDGGSDVLTVQKKMAPSKTFSVSAGWNIELFGAEQLPAELGLSVYHNNYKGVGYRIDGGMGYKFASSTSKVSSKLGINFSLDPSEGTSLSPSLSLEASELGEKDNKVISGNISLGYHSRYGVSNMTFGVAGPSSEAQNRLQSYGLFGAPISLSSPAVYPTIQMPMVNTNLSVKFKGGASGFAIFPNGYGRGFYNKQSLAQRDFNYELFGYLNLQNATKDGLMDFNREKDGVIQLETPNLPIPALTYDVFTLSGQGLSGMFRAYRNELGVVHDNTVSSTTNGANVGVDLAPAKTHFGANLSVMHARNTAGEWDGYSFDNIKPRFMENVTNSLEKNYYFKFHGEHTYTDAERLQKINGSQAVSYPTFRQLTDYVTLTPQARSKIFNSPAVQFDDLQSGQVNRPQAILTVKNKDLISSVGNQDVQLPLFRNVGYEDYNNELGQLVDRSAFRDRLIEHPNHIAGFIVTSTDGIRYVYGLPVYSLKEVEHTYATTKQSDENTATISYDASVENDEDAGFRNVTTLSEYPASYLLTAIVGPDYVDTQQDGVSGEDLGYWVKFNYEDAGIVKWRTPFEDAFYNHGYLPDNKDDRGYYKYGERENYYLKSAETKTHIAHFETDSELRLDGLNVSNQENGGGTEKALKRLKKITLSSKLNSREIEIMSLNMEHEYLLCKADDGQFGQSNSPEGKLTLARIYSTYPGSDVKYNQYAFGYNGDGVQGVIEQDENGDVPLDPSELTYDFNVNHIDQWGFYKEADNNRLFPYVDQSENKATLDSWSSAWSLSDVKLPSGAKLNVNYEADDYGYVQHKPVLELFELKDESISDNGLRLRFKVSDETNNISDFVDNLPEDQIYFKTKVYLKSGEPDFVTGYARLDRSRAADFDIESVGEEKYGIIYVMPERGFHPIRLAAWNHMRSNQPNVITKNLLQDLNPINAEGSSKKQIVKYFKNLAVGLGPATDLFKGFNQRAYDNGWSSDIEIGESWIRLSTPNRSKIGGGHRVQSIVLSNPDDGAMYGQYYRYTLEDGSSTSGVASYEPSTGGEENPFRVAKKYSDNVPFNSDNNLYFENPVNETYFPGASVGYSRVEVMSLPSAVKSGASTEQFGMPEGNKFGSSGKVVHEFYTTKDFPFFTDETKNDNRGGGNMPDEMDVIPFVGMRTFREVVCSQGYAINTNDMNGKPKKMSVYEQLDNGSFSDIATSHQKYRYRSKTRSYQRTQVNELINTVANTNNEAIVEPAEDGVHDGSLGVEYEIFADTRKYEDKSYEAGVNANLDMIFLLVTDVPAPSVWPNGSIHKSVLKTVVVNKVIFNSGLLEEIESMKDGAITTTKIRQWDKYTGQPVMQQIDERFSDTPQFSYSEPAYIKDYTGMGPASDNLGLVYTIDNIVRLENKENEVQASVGLLPPDDEQYLFPGDELLIREIEIATNTTKTVGSAIYLGKGSGSHTFYTDVTFSDDVLGYTYSCFVYRSGRRNILSVNRSSLEGLSETTLDRPREISLPTFQKLVPQF